MMDGRSHVCAGVRTIHSPSSPAIDDLDAGPYPKPALGWYVVGTLFIAWVFAYLDRLIITLLVPLLKADLALSDTQISLVQGIGFSLFFALAGLPIGRLVDRRNRRNIIIVGICVWSVMTILCGFATNFWELFAARAGVGIGEAVLAPASFSIVADYFRPTQRGRAMGVIAAGPAIGAASSLVLGGLILRSLEGVDTMVVPILGELVPRQITFLAAGLPGFFLALLLLTIPEPVRRERITRAEHAAPFLPYLKANRATFGYAYCAYTCNFITGYANVIWGPVVFMRVHDMTPGNAGIMAGTIFLATGLTSSLLSGWLSDYRVKLRPFAGRFAIVGAVLPITILFAGMYAFAGRWELAILAYVGVHFFVNLNQASAYITLQDLAPGELRGQVIALYLMIANIVGLGLAPTIVALVTDYVFQDENLVALSIAVVTVPTLFLGLLCAWRGTRHYAVTRQAVVEALGTQSGVAKD